LNINTANAQAVGTNYNGLSMDVKTGKITGMAWGSEVVGWLSFNADTDVVTLTSQCEARDLNGRVKFTAVSAGGSGSYEYQWDNGQWSTSPIFYKSYNNNYNVPVKVSLNVREMGKQYFITPICTFTPTPITEITFIPVLDPLCSVVPEKLVPNRPVTFSLISDPQPAGNNYTYTWSIDNLNLAGGRTLQHTFTNTSGPRGYGVKVTVRDTTDTRRQQVVINCGSFIVNEPKIDLYIGANHESAIINLIKKDRNPYYTTKVGRQFTLVLDNTLEMYDAQNYPTGYRCNTTTTYSDSNRWLSLNVNENSSILTMTANTVGEYSFTIDCNSTDPTKPAESRTAILRVISTSEREI